MKLGFTGTRRGMTGAQLEAVRRLLCEWKPGEFHHGCCFGADAEAARLAFSLGGLGVVGHPSDIASMTSNQALAACHERHEPKPPLARNSDIVDACETLLACPEGAEERQRSGTWSTVRYARRQGKPVVIVYPDGSREG